MLAPHEDKIARCREPGCAFTARWPGDLAYHEVVHQERFGSPLTTVEREIGLQAAQAMLARLASNQRAAKRATRVERNATTRADLAEAA